MSGRSRRHGEFPRLSSRVSVVPHAPDCVELREGAWNVSSVTLHWDCEGDLPALVRGLDGTTSLASLAGSLRVREADASEVVLRLETLGLLEDDSDPARWYLSRTPFIRREPSINGSSVEGATTLLGSPTLTGLTRTHLEESGFRVVACGPELAGHLSLDFESWSRDGLELARRVQAFRDHVPRTSLLILLQDGLNPINALAIGRLAYEARVPLLYAAVDGVFLVVGPLLRGSPCFQCFETRVMMNLRGAAEYQRFKNALAELASGVGPSQVPTPILGLVSSLVALEAMHFLSTGRAFLVNKVLGIYLPSFEFSFHPVLPVSSCRACGAVLERDEGSLYFDFGVGDPSG